MPVTLKMTVNEYGQRTWTGVIKLKRDTEMVAAMENTRPLRIVVKAGTEVAYRLEETRSGTYATVHKLPSRGYYASKKLSDRDEAAERRKAEEAFLDGPCPVPPLDVIRRANGGGQYAPAPAAVAAPYADRPQPEPDDPPYKDFPDDRDAYDPEAQDEVAREDAEGRSFEQAFAESKLARKARGQAMRGQAKVAKRNRTQEAVREANDHLGGRRSLRDAARYFTEGK